MNRARSLWLAGMACLAVLSLTSGLQSQDSKGGQQAKLKLLVPANAVVEIEGFKTKTVGEERHYVSPTLPGGKSYSYTVVVTWKDADGKDQERKEVLKVQPGQERSYDLRPAGLAKVPVEEKKPVVEEKKPVVEEKKPAVEDKKPVVEKKEEDPDKRPDVIFVPTPHDVVKKMLEVAKVGKDDIVYDLGCGDGRIVVTAVKDFGAKKGIGYDIDPQRVKESLENVKKNKVEDKVTIEKKDIFTLDLSGASVITLYLLPALNVKLIPQLEKLRPGSRIVSHDFAMEGVTPDATYDVEAANDQGDSKRSHKVYLWTIPLKKEKAKDE
jgi:uncharacterized protein (TIGR03000 family)